MTKVCVFCGADVTRQPRVKDAAGHYYCRPCHDARRAEREGRGPTPPPVVPDAHARAADTMPQAPRGARSAAGRSSPLDWIMRPHEAARRLESGTGALAFLARTGFPTWCVAFLFALADGVRPSAALAPVVGDSWPVIIGIGALGALLWGTIYWLVGPAFLVLRARMGGGTVPSFALARAVYFVSAMPACALALVGVALLPFAFGSPDAYLEGAPSAHHALIPVLTYGALGLGCITQFLVAWRGWGMNALAAALLLVALPWAWYAVAAVGTALLAVSMPQVELDRDLVAPAPMTYSTNSATRANDSKVRHAAEADLPFAFDHPQSWSIEAGPSAYAPGQRSVRVVSPDESWVQLSLVRGTTSDLAAQQQFVRELAQLGYGLAPLGDVRSMGDFTGSGKQFALFGRSQQTQGVQGQVQVFVAPLGDGERLLVATFLLDTQRAEGQRGINMVISSLKVQP